MTQPNNAPLKTCIFGIQGSGKTYYAQQAYKQFKKPIVFVVNEGDGWHKLKGIYVYQCANRHDIKEEFTRFIKEAHKWAEQGKIDAIIIDEADLFFTNNFEIDQTMTDLVTNHRHIGNGVALWFMTRRPQDIPTRIVESSHYLVIFKLEGFNAIQRFKDIHPRLPELIYDLTYEKHDYVFKEIGREPEVRNAV